jgi:hypothetical protein
VFFQKKKIKLRSAILFIGGCGLLLVLAGTSARLAFDINHGRVEPLSYLKKYAQGYAVIGVETKDFTTPVCISLIIEQRQDRYFWTTNKNIELIRYDYAPQETVFLNPAGSDFIKVHHFNKNSAPLTDCARYQNIQEIKAEPTSIAYGKQPIQRLSMSSPMDDFPQSLQIEKGKIIIDKELPDLPFCDHVTTKRATTTGNWNIYERYLEPMERMTIKIQCNLSEDYSLERLKELEKEAAARVKEPHVKFSEYYRGQSDPAGVDLINGCWSGH